MNRQMLREITESFEALGEQPDVGAIVVTGEGRGFMAGADIKEYAAQSEAEFDAFQARGARMYAAIADNQKPVIAAVNGFALGGGFELVLCCDIVIAATSAKMGLPEIRLGLIPGGGGTQRTVRVLGRNRANFLLMTGAILPAAEFERAGLVNELVEPERLMARAGELAEAIAAEPSEAIAGLKVLTAIAMDGDLAGGLEQERALVGRLFRGDIAKQRVRAFAAKSETRSGRK
jgi:enoyl-CoA hydratase/3-hydroxypropionyl-coenzyme A dehydratase